METTVMLPPWGIRNRRMQLSTKEMATHMAAMARVRLFQRPLALPAWSKARPITTRTTSTAQVYHLVSRIFSTAWVNQLSMRNPPSEV